MFQFKRK